MSEITLPSLSLSFFFIIIIFSLSLSLSLLHTHRYKYLQYIIFVFTVQLREGDIMYTCQRTSNNFLLPNWTPEPPAFFICFYLYTLHSFMHDNPFPTSITTGGGEGDGMSKKSWPTVHTVHYTNDPSPLMLHVLPEWLTHGTEPSSVP